MRALILGLSVALLLAGQPSFRQASAAAAVRIQTNCPEDHFYDRNLDECQPCPVLSESPTDQEVNHYRSLCGWNNRSNEQPAGGGGARAGNDGAGADDGRAGAGSGGAGAGSGGAGAGKADTHGRVKVEGGKGVGRPVNKGRSEDARGDKGGKEGSKSGSGDGGGIKGGTSGGSDDAAKGKTAAVVVVPLVVVLTIGGVLYRGRITGCCMYRQCRERHHRYQEASANEEAVTSHPPDHPDDGPSRRGQTAVVVEETPTDRAGPTVIEQPDRGTSEQTYQQFPPSYLE